MFKANKKEMLDLFSSRLQRNFQSHCSEHYLNDNLDNFITYLIDREFISLPIIKRYAVKAAFVNLHDMHKIQKTQAVDMLARRFNVSRRTVWNILRQEDK